MPAGRKKDKTVQERRREMFDLISVRGADSHTVCEQLALKYGKTPTAMQKDWENRATWGLVETPDVQRVMVDILGNLREYQRELWDIIEAQDSKVEAKLAAISRGLDLEFKRLVAVQSVGFVPRAVEKIEVTQPELSLEMINAAIHKAVEKFGGGERDEDKQRLILNAIIQDVKVQQRAAALDAEEKEEKENHQLM